MSAEDLAALPPADLVQLVLALQTQFAALEAEVETLRAENAALRARLEQPPKTPENSSVPPAKAWEGQRRTAAPTDQPPAKRGPKPGHRGVSRSRVASEAVDVVLVCRPERCRHCGAALPAQGGKVVGRKQVVELPPVRPLVYEARRVRVRCRHCRHTTVGQYPPGYGATGRCGPRLVATAADLHEEHHVADARLGTLFADLYGVAVSTGTLVAAVGWLGQALVPAAAAIGDAVRQAAGIGADETSVRVDGRTHGEWVFQRADAAYHQIVPRRNTAVVLTFLRGTVPNGWGSDLWKPQLAAALQAAVYQICWAHQLRALRYAEQVEVAAGRAAGVAWVQQLAALLREAIHTRTERDAGRLAGAVYAAAVTTIEQRCDGWLAEAAPRGCGHDLQRRFMTHRRGLLTFLHHPAVPPTNNASERSLRPSVVPRKVTGGCRNDAWATAYAALRTVTETARKRGQAIFGTLFAAAGTPLPSPAGPAT